MEKKLDKKLEKKKLDCEVAFTGGRTESLTLMKNLVLVHREFSGPVAYQC